MKKALILCLAAALLCFALTACSLGRNNVSTTRDGHVNGTNASDFSDVVDDVTDRVSDLFTPDDTERTPGWSNGSTGNTTESTGRTTTGTEPTTATRR